jgi:hypothetical protein
MRQYALTNLASAQDLFSEFYRDRQQAARDIDGDQDFSISASSLAPEDGFHFARTADADVSGAT